MLTNDMGSGCYNIELSRKCYNRVMWLLFLGREVEAIEIAIDNDTLCKYNV